MKKLFIISNESIFEKEKKYFCDNLDMKSTPEGLSANFVVNILARKSMKQRSHHININEVKLSRSIYSFLQEIIKTSKNQEIKYLIMSISPYTFLACIFLNIIKKKPIVYLRSDGYGEYKVIFGFIGPVIYHLMFSIIARVSHLISCRKYILRNKKGSIVSPSQLDQNWLNNTKKANLDKIKLLYIGRLKKEKGIFSLIEIIKNCNEVFLSIVGCEKNSLDKIHQSNVKLYNVENNKKKLIKYYDDHNIFILPSFTEGHPMALLEALARKRPVIIFEEIKHVIEEKKGIFVAKRNKKNLLETISYIKKNYEEIQKTMEQNRLPSKKKFLRELENLISNLK